MQHAKPHISFWGVTGLALVWNLIGCLNYIAQTNAETVAQMPEVYQVIINGRPAWATAAFGVAVFGGAVGCILLLLRKRVALQVLILSLGGLVVNAVFTFNIIGLAPPVVLSLLVGAALLWYATIVRRFGWLR